MERTRQDYDADTLTVLYAWRQGWATDNDLREATDLHQQAIASLRSTPTPIVTPPRTSEAGAVEVGVSPDTRRACWSCRWADSELDCLKPFEPNIALWCVANVGSDNVPLPTARDCPGYEDK